jgi:F0F1-type ATP synthase membrane subunit c/vacuolar-type H+-ATPase subunit K
MTSILKVDTIQDADGNNIINESGNTITIGASGDTISIPSGATLANSGTVTGITQGITMVDSFRLNANQSVSGNGTSLISNYERVDTFSPGFIGTGMTESSGIFTFPSTGIYKITSVMHFLASADSNYLRINHEISTDSGSSFDAQGEANTHAKNGQYAAATQISTFDVTNTSTHQIRFQFRHNNSGNLIGATTQTRTGFLFERLGNT